MPPNEPILARIDKELIAARERLAWTRLLDKIDKDLQGILTSAGNDTPFSSTRDEVIKLGLRHFRRWLNTKFRIYVQVWKQQGHPVTADFVREVYDVVILPELKKGREFVDERIRHAQLDLRF